jgi:hypothetical protein
LIVGYALVRPLDVWPLDDCAQCLTIFLCQLAGPRQVRQKGCEGPIAESLGQRSQPSRDELIAIQRRYKSVNEQGTVTLNIFLNFHAI